MGLRALPEGGPVPGILVLPRDAELGLPSLLNETG